MERVGEIWYKISEEEYNKIASYLLIIDSAVKGEADSYDIESATYGIQYMKKLFNKD